MRPCILWLLTFVVACLSAASTAADLLVTSHNSNRVVRYDSTTGEYLGEFVGGANIGEQIHHPMGIAMDAQRRFYVSNGDDSILRFNNAGVFTDVFVPAGADGPHDPLGLHFGPNGNLFVGSFATQSVREYSASGEFIRTAASHPDMRRPIEFTFAPGGDLFVSDNHAGAVFHFSASGDFIQKLGEGLLNWQPFGITFGPDGNLYVANSARIGIDRFDGETLAYLGTFASHTAAREPLGIAFGPDGNLYAASWQHSRIVRFDGQTGAVIDVFVPSFSGELYGPKALLFVTPIPEPATGVLALAAAPLFIRQAKKRSR